MKNLLNFFLEVEKLKEIPRTGWVLMEVKNPETIADHTFRMAFSAWLLSTRKNLNIERTIKTALSHDLCEVYAGDKTPFFYYSKLPKDKSERKKRLMRWPRLSQKEKRKRSRKKIKEEEKSLQKLIKFLPQDIGKEIFSYWFNFEKRGSREGNFVKQVDRIETLVQSIEYFGTREKIGGTSWWEGTEEIVDDPLLLNFLKVIQKKFYGKVVGQYQKDEELENILDFLVNIGKLKRHQRTIWKLMGIENPETVASHIFSVTLMVWIFGRERENLSMKRLLKMALCHELPSVFTGDLITPYSKIPIKVRPKREVFKKWPRLSKKEKEKKFLKDYQKEKRALEKLTFKLNPPLRKEILWLWEEYKTSSTPEARFLNQINVCAVLLQGLQYKKRYKDLPIDWLWEWAFEKCENEFVLSFLDALKNKFYGTFLFPKKLLTLLRLK